MSQMSGALWKIKSQRNPGVLQPPQAFFYYLEWEEKQLKDFKQGDRTELLFLNDYLGAVKET